MRGERQLLRLGEYLVSRACQGLPVETREERYREWVAELPVILRDPQVSFAPRRAARMLAYALDTLRGTAKTPGRPADSLPPRHLGVLTTDVGDGDTADDLEQMRTPRVRCGSPQSAPAPRRSSWSTVTPR